MTSLENGIEKDAATFLVERWHGWAARAFVLVVMAALMLSVTPVLAAEESVAAPESAHQVLERAIKNITERVVAERDKIKADPNYARQVVEEELGDLVDFKRITRLVMAGHFASATREQKYRFLGVFRESLINTYSAGLTLYDGQEITVLAAQKGDVSANKARVRTEIQTGGGKVIPVFFSVYRNKEGSWQVENVIVNGLNLGKTFRSQFDQSVQQYGGDLDQVIDNWSSALDAGKPVDAGTSTEPTEDDA